MATRNCQKFPRRNVGSTVREKSMACLITDLTCANIFFADYVAAIGQNCLTISKNMTCFHSVFGLLVSFWSHIQIRPCSPDKHHGMKKPPTKVPARIKKRLAYMAFNILPDNVIVFRLRPLPIARSPFSVHEYSLFEFTYGAV